MRNQMFDAIKGLAIISVVFSHTYRGYTDPTAVFIREIAMWSVPAFFVLQGYFIYSPKLKPWIQGTVKKLKKAYVPYLFWAFFYGYFNLIVQSKKFTLEDVVLGKTAIHLYFMFHYMLFAIFLPLMYKLPKAIRMTTLWFMVFSNLLLTILLEISKSEHMRIIHYSGPNPLKWWGFVAIGMIIAETPGFVCFFKNHRKLIISLASISFIFGIVEPYYFNHLGYLFNKFALWPMSLGLLVILAAYYSRENALLKKQLAYIGERTFGIYLPHILILFYLQKIIPNERLITVVIILVTCVLLTNLKNRVEISLSTMIKRKCSHL